MTRTATLTRRRFTQAALLGATGLAHAQSGDFWALLRQGGCVVLMRHALTEPGIGDPAEFRLGVCSTQRNLSDEGRAQSRRTGEAFQREGIAADYNDDPETITRRARVYLREKYMQAQAGITGANFVCADTGRMLLVTNEGNSRFGMAPTNVHIALVGIANDSSGALLQATQGGGLELLLQQPIYASHYNRFLDNTFGRSATGAATPPPSSATSCSAASCG